MVIIIINFITPTNFLLAISRTQQITYDRKSVICEIFIFIGSLFYSRPSNNGGYHINHRCYGQCYIYATCSSSFIRQFSRSTHIFP